MALMAIDPRVRQHFSDETERASESAYRAMGFEVEALDLKGENTGKRPEFVVHFRGRPLLLHEDKALLSAGALDDENRVRAERRPRPADQEIVHASTLDERSRNRMMVIDPGVAVDRVYRLLHKAVAKYRAATKELPDYASLPFVVGLHFEFYADVFDLIDRRRLANTSEISGIVKIERNRKLLAALADEPEPRQRERVDNDDWAGLPPESLEFRLLPNEAAVVPLPEEFVSRCVPFDADLPAD